MKDLSEKRTPQKVGVSYIWCMAAMKYTLLLLIAFLTSAYARSSGLNVPSVSSRIFKDQSNGYVGRDGSAEGRRIDTVVVATKKVETGHGDSLMPVIINIVADLAPHGMLPLAFGLNEGGLVGIVPALFLYVYLEDLVLII